MSDSNVNDTQNEVNREAGKLQAALDRLAAGESWDDVADSLAGDGDILVLADLATKVEPLLRAKAPAAMRSRQQVALQDAFDMQNRRAVGAAAFGSTPRFRRLALRFSSGLLALSLATGSAVVASANSLPGEVLYPVKRAAESARLALTLNAPSRAALRVSLASERINEIRRLVDLGIMPSPEIIEAMFDSLAASEREAEASGDASLLVRVREETIEHALALRALAEQTDDKTRKLIEAALDGAGEQPEETPSEDPSGSRAADPPDSGEPPAPIAAASPTSEGELEPVQATAALPGTSVPFEPTSSPTAEPTTSPTEPRIGGSGGGSGSPTSVPPPPVDPPAEPSAQPDPDPTSTVPNNPKATRRAIEEPTPPAEVTPTRSRPRPPTPVRPRPPGGGGDGPRRP